MRYWNWAPALLWLAGCSSGPGNGADLVLNDPYWERVNVQVVVTKSADCDNRGEGFISTKEFVMRKDTTKTIEAPNGASICWRHDRNPNSPVAGAWSGWSRATLFPGQSTETDI